MPSKSGTKVSPVNDTESKIADAMKAVMDAVTAEPERYTTRQLYTKFSKEFGGRKIVREAVARLEKDKAIAFTRKDRGEGRGEYVLLPTSGSNEAAATLRELTFDVESHLQKALRSEITQLEPGLKIVDNGREHSVSSGRIDILAEDSDATPVVIELKAGKADKGAIGQILAYMGDMRGDAKGRNVRGILVAGDFDNKAVAASKAVPAVALKKYTFRFSFKDVPSAT
jgi:Endonuclease NucS